MPELPAFQEIRRFPNEEVAGRAYWEAQQALRNEPKDCDVGIFRLKVNSVWHVVVLGVGDRPPTSLLKKLDEILVGGESATLPDEAALQLTKRMNGRRDLGVDWFEGHYRR